MYIIIESFPHTYIVEHRFPCSTLKCTTSCTYIQWKTWGNLNMQWSLIVLVLLTAWHLKTWQHDNWKRLGGPYSMWKKIISTWCRVASATMATQTSCEPISLWLLSFLWPLFRALQHYVMYKYRAAYYIPHNEVHWGEVRMLCVKCSPSLLFSTAPLLPLMYSLYMCHACWPELYVASVPGPSPFCISLWAGMHHTYEIDVQIM